MLLKAFSVSRSIMRGARVGLKLALTTRWAGTPVLHSVTINYLLLLWGIPR